MSVRREWCQCQMLQKSHGERARKKIVFSNLRLSVTYETWWRVRQRHPQIGAPPASSETAAEVWGLETELGGTWGGEQKQEKWRRLSCHHQGLHGQSLLFFSKKRKMRTKEEGIVLGWFRGLEQSTPEIQTPLGWNEKGGREERGLILGGSGMDIRGAGGRLAAALPWDGTVAWNQRMRQLGLLGFSLLIDLILIFFPNALDLHI